MSSSTGLGGVVDEGAAGSPELVVEGDAGCERKESCGDAAAQAAQRARAVAFEGEDVLGRPVDRFDALADRGQVRAAAGLVLAARAHDDGAQGVGVVLE